MLGSLELLDNLLNLCITSCKAIYNYIIYLMSTKFCICLSTFQRFCFAFKQTKNIIVYMIVIFTFDKYIKQSSFIFMNLSSFSTQVYVFCLKLCLYIFVFLASIIFLLI